MLSKNDKIANTVRLTKLRRQTQQCKVYTVKIQSNKLSSTQKQYLQTVFYEAKCWYNWVLNVCNEFPDQYDIFHFNCSPINIFKLDSKNQKCSVVLNTIPAASKQALTDRMANSIRALAHRKAKGGKVGYLKFKSSISCIDLKQYNHTHKIIGNTIKLQKCKKAFKVNGLDQIPANAEFANAKLIQKNDTYYIALTTFIDKQPKSKPTIDKVLGLDLGCQTTLTTSEGKKYKISIPETERLKHLQRLFAKKQKHSKNAYKVLKKLRTEYQKICNRKTDTANKLIAELKQYKTIIYQSDDLDSWKSSKFKLGKTIQHSILGRLKSKLNQLDNAVAISKWLPTTKLCTSCGSIISLTLADRTFKCQCGISIDRDVHAAQNMLFFYKNSIGVGRTEFKRGEIQDQIKRAIYKPSLSESLKHEGSTL